MALTKEQKQEAAKHAEEYCSDANLDAILFHGTIYSIETACEEGCEVEPDGKCPHGFPSPLRILGYI